MWVLLSLFLVTTIGQLVFTSVILLRERHVDKLEVTFVLVADWLVLKSLMALLGDYVILVLRRL